jgi:hypothetical protein
MAKPTDKYEGLRIYTVVPGTVQTPIKVNYTPRGKADGGSIYSFGRYENTRDIVQPAGRQAQQAAHVRGMVEHHLIFLELNKVLYGSRRIPKHLSTQIPPTRITGIVKAARDSFEVLHVKKLLEASNIRYFEFHDTQEDLYEDVVTAIATEPVTPFAVAGILDYLPLWSGK